MVRLREISHDDRHILRGFDRGLPLGGPACVGGHRHWGDHRSRRPAGDGGSQFGIETVHGSRLVGSLSTVESDPLTGVFSYSIGIGRPHRRCGYASDAVIALLSHMFEQRGFRTCVISVYSGNLASLSLHGRLGFRTEGRMRDSQVQRGNIRFLVSMSITASDFAARFSTEPDPDMHRGRHWRTRRGRHWHVPHLNHPLELSAPAMQPSRRSMPSSPALDQAVPR